MAEMDEADSALEDVVPDEVAADAGGAVPEETDSEAITSVEHLDGQLDNELGFDEALNAWGEKGGERTDEIAPIEFAQLDELPVRREKKNDRLHNVMVDVTVELGRKEMSIRELLALKEQDCIELEKLAGEPFDLLVNQRPFAEGEIVVVTDVMAVRITRLREFSEGAGSD